MLRPLLINGFMSTGKSTLARRVAERTGHPYVDLDARLVRRTGLGIPQFFEQHGEGAFREVEREELEQLLTSWPGEFERPPVCALGGGALVHRPTRVLALRHAVVVSLEASLATLVERARRQGGRPLLMKNPEAEAARLLEQRRITYREANAVLDSEALAPEVLAERAMEVWQRDSIAVAAGERSYVVEVGSGILSQRLPSFVQGASSLLLVSDSTVHGLYGERVEHGLREGDNALSSVVLAPGEQAKQLGSIERIYQAALERGVDRQGAFIGLGGGVVTDMTGFAAATWLRGVRWVAAATTLLAMVDASVGGKTGVDFGPAKNSVGAFWQPSGVVCDTDAIQSESERAYRGALAEVVKTALIGDPQLFALLEDESAAIARREPEVLTRIVRRSVALKAWVVATDERESGIRAWLNLGHTLGHALEAQGGYARLTHGEAVSLGLVAALRIGKQLGETPPELVERTGRLLQRLELPHDLTGEPLTEAVELLGHDKKRAGRSIRFVVARAVGDVALRPLEVSEIKRLALAL